MDITRNIETFFQNLGITLTSLEVEEREEDVLIRIETPDSPLLIGIHGRNLAAFQHLLNRMIEHWKQSFYYVHLEVNDYVKNKDARLFRFLEKKIAELRAHGGKVAIQKLTSYERKKAHDYIHSLAIAGLSSESEGEKEERLLYIVYSGELVPYLPEDSGTIPAKDSSETRTSRHEKALNELGEDGIGI